MDLRRDSPSAEKWPVRGGKTHVWTTMTEAEHTKQGESPALGVVSANVAHMSCLLLSEASDHARYGHVLRDSIGASL